METVKTRPIFWRILERSRVMGCTQIIVPFANKIIYFGQIYWNFARCYHQRRKKYTAESKDIMNGLLIYIGLFLGIFLEGELVLLSAVIAAAHGHLNLWAVVIIAVLATLAADSFYFYLGRKRASKWIAQSKWAPKLKTVHQRFENHKIKMLLGYRFLYGFRLVTPLFLGTQTISFREFMKYSLMGTLLWAAVVSMLGFLFGQLILTYLKHIESVEYYVIAFLLLMAMIFFMMHTWKSKGRTMKR